MSLSSERIYKRKPSIIVRQQLLQVLLRKYIKKVYFGVLIEKKAKRHKHETNYGDRQLLRQEYYNDIYECLINYCKLNSQTSATKPTVNLNRFTTTTLTSRHEFIESIKKKRSNKTSKTTDNNGCAKSDKGEFSR